MMLLPAGLSALPPFLHFRKDTNNNDDDNAADINHLKHNPSRRATHAR